MNSYLVNTAFWASWLLGFLASGIGLDWIWVKLKLKLVSGLDWVGLGVLLLRCVAWIR